MQPAGRQFDMLGLNDQVGMGDKAGVTGRGTKASITQLMSTGVKQGNKCNMRKKFYMF